MKASGNTTNCEPYPAASSINLSALSVVKIVLFTTNPYV